MENFHALFKYDSEMNKALIQHAIDAGVSSEKFTKIAAHMLGAIETWLYRLQGSNGAVPAVWPEKTLQQLFPHLEKVYSRFQDYLSSGSYSASKEVTYYNSAGKNFTSTTTEILTHLLLHNSYHRGQLNLLLRQAGNEPIIVDYIVYERNKPATQEKLT